MYISLCVYVYVYVCMCLCIYIYAYAHILIHLLSEDYGSESSPESGQRLDPWPADPLGFTGSPGFPIWGPGRWKMDAFSSTLASKSGLVHWSKPPQMVGTVETPKFSRVAEIIQPRGLMFKVWIYVQFGRKWMWLSWQLLPTGFEENGQTDLQFGPAPEQSWEAEPGEFSNKGGPQTIGDVSLYIYPLVF